jgi:tRNA(Ile)-lysidine synthase
MINKKFTDFIKIHKLLEKGDRILISFSGGPDSVFLFHLLNENKKLFNVELALFHLNHNLRNDESLRDEEFCRKFAERNGVNIFIKSFSVKDYAAEKKVSIEVAGREIRYKMLKGNFSPM